MGQRHSALRRDNVVDSRSVKNDKTSDSASALARRSGARNELSSCAKIVPGNQPASASGRQEASEVGPNVSGRNTFAQFIDVDKSLTAPIAGPYGDSSSVLSLELRSLEMSSCD
jgi:hypothetical protein